MLGNMPHDRERNVFFNIGERFPNNEDSPRAVVFGKPSYAMSDYCASRNACRMISRPEHNNPALRLQALQRVGINQLVLTGQDEAIRRMIEGDCDRGRRACSSGGGGGVMGCGGGDSSRSGSS